MALRASDLIDEALDYASGLTRQNSPPRPALRRLNRMVVTIRTTIADQNPEPISSTVTIESATIATALSSGNPVTIPAYITFLTSGARAVRTDGREIPVAVVPRPVQYRRSSAFPSVAVADRALFLTDLRKLNGDRHGWEEIEQLLVRMVAQATDLTNPTENLDVPDSVAGLLVADLAGFFLRRLVAEHPEFSTAIARAQDDYDRNWNSFIDSVRLMDRGTDWHVSDDASGPASWGVE